MIDAALPPPTPRSITQPMCFLSFVSLFGEARKGGSVSCVCVCMYIYIYYIYIFRSYHSCSMERCPRPVIYLHSGGQEGHGIRRNHGKKEKNKTKNEGEKEKNHEPRTKNQTKITQNQKPNGPNHAIEAPRVLLAPDVLRCLPTHHRGLARRKPYCTTVVRSTET